MASIEKKLENAAKKGAKGDKGTVFRSSYEIDADASVPEITVAGSPIADIASNYSLNVTDQGLTQVDPNAAVNEMNQFVNNFNAVQAANNAAIGDVTHRQGTDIPAQTGGLHGTDYWTNLYQTNQVNAQIANLKAATQLQALNDVMQNLKDVEAEKLNQEQRRLTALRAKFIPSFYDYTPNPNQYTYDPKAAKKAAAASRTPSTTTPNAGNVTTKTVTTKSGTTQGTLSSGPSGSTRVIAGTINGQPYYAEQIGDETRYYDVNGKEVDKNGNPVNRNTPGGGGGGGGW